MSKENPLGLAELIDQVKQELLSKRNTNTPLLSVDQVELELQVLVHKEGKAGVRIYVVEAGVEVNRDDVQKVKVTLSPLLNKKELLEAYEKEHPGSRSIINQIATEGGVKGRVDPRATYDE
jgi:Trypsin-co-occurring domain 2